MDDHRLDIWDRWNKQAQEKPVRSPFWERLYRITNAHVLNTMRSRDAEEKFPAIYAASKQFGEERLLAYLEVLYEWSVRGIMPYSNDDTSRDKETKAKYLLDNKEILKTIMPPRKIPKFLYRGIDFDRRSLDGKKDIEQLKGMRKRKESLFYSTNKPVTAWSTHDSLVKAVTVATVLFFSARLSCCQLKQLLSYGHIMAILKYCDLIKLEITSGHSGSTKDSEFPNGRGVLNQKISNRPVKASLNWRVKKYERRRFS